MITTPDTHLDIDLQLKHILSLNKANPLLTPQQPFISQGLRWGNRETSLDLLLSQNTPTGMSWKQADPSKGRDDMKTGRAECTKTSHETLTTLGWVLFIEKPARMMKLKTLRNRGWGTKRVYPFACWVKKCSWRGWCRMSDYGWHWLMWTVMILSFSENTAGWFYNQYNYCCHVSTPIYYTPLLLY